MSGSTLSSFTPGDIIISVVGSTAASGGGTYSDNQAAPITLEEIDPSTGAIVGTYVLPQQTVTVNGVTEYAVSGEYGSSSEGILQLSGNGKSLTIAGYDTNAGTYNAGGTTVYGNAALAQSTSLTTQTQYIPIARTVADISFDKTTGTIATDSTTTLYNIYNTNNPRSVATVNGTSFYLGGQGVSGDTTQGVFYAPDGANAATAIDTSSDAREVEIVNGQLYVSKDSKQHQTSIGTYGAALPTSATTETVLPGISGQVTLTAAEENGINNADVGSGVSLSPEQYFFANSSTLYVADGGNPKSGGLGDGGLQKWSLVDGTWHLDYTLASGLNLVPDTAASGTSGLIGLTGVVNGGTVVLYATNSTLTDTGQTYLYTISDSLAATTLPASETFSALVSAGADSNIRGVAFAPVDALPAGSAVTVVSGTPQSDGTVNSGGSLTVSSGGVATGFTVLSGATETVSSGGIESGTVLAGGASETLYGSANGDSIEGTQLVASGGTVEGSISNETVYNGGVASLSIKGTSAANVTVENGGQLQIDGNISASNTTILAGGIVALQSNKATLTGSLTFSGSGGQLQLGTSSAGYGDQATISGFATGDSVLFTGFASGATVTGSYNSTTSVTTETVTSGGVTQTLLFAGNVVSSLGVTSTASGAELVVTSAVQSSGTTVTFSSGNHVGVIVSAGETLSVLTGASITSATVLAGGSVILAGGTDSGSTILSGGFETVSGSATGDIIDGTQLIATIGASVSDETVMSGGVLELYIKSATATGTTVSSGGELLVSGAAIASNTVLDNGALLELQSPKPTLEGTLTFNGAATYEVTSATAATGGYGDQAPIQGFAAGDVIALPIITSAGATITSAVSGGNTDVTVSGGGNSETFMFAGLFSPGFFALAPFSGTGVEITATASVPCYCHGTLIETDHGEVAVETLQAGDRVLTVSGALQPIRWVGRRSYAGRFLAGHRNVLPILIRAGALGSGLPRRDLRISPCHAMLLDGVLVPGSELVNGTTIVQDHACTEVHYVHIELDQHDAILAEGAPSETFIDHDSAGLFHNASGRPEGGAVTDFAPRIADGYTLEAIRRRLAA